MGHRQGSLAHILDILYAGSLFALHWRFQNQSPSIPIDNKDLEEAQERPPRWWQLEHSPSEERLVELVLFSLDGFRWTWQKLQYQLWSLWGNRLFTVEHDKRIQDFGYKLKQEMYRLRFYLSIWLYCRIFNRIASWKLRLLGLHLKERKTCPGFITTFWVVAGCPGIPT